jgi:DNA-binding transcriptional ArsR family regulator
LRAGSGFPSPPVNLLAALTSIEAYPLCALVIVGIDSHCDLRTRRVRRPARAAGRPEPRTSRSGLAQPTVNHHLKVLYEAGALEREKRATTGSPRAICQALL